MAKAERRITRVWRGSGESKAEACVEWDEVTSTATRTPAANPMTVLWLPSQRSLIGRFHPCQYRTNGGAMFATYAGAMK